jgi:hypothetical protein
MIYLGYREKEKIDIINEYIKKNEIKDIYFITNDKFKLDIFFGNIKYVTYKDIIQYAYYYRIIENTTKNTLIILNEIHKDTNRYNLTYNCIRTFLNGTGNVLIFNYLPIIYDKEDFCSLIDFETQTRFKYLKLDKINLQGLDISYRQLNLRLNKIMVPTGLFDETLYIEHKKKIFDELNSKDIHTIPRKLQLFTSKIKTGIYTSENCISRTKRKNTVSFKSLPREKLKIIDLPFHMTDLINYICMAEIEQIDIISTGLKVDVWFENRVEKLIKELEYVYNKL